MSSSDEDVVRRPGRGGTAHVQASPGSERSLSAKESHAQSVFGSDGENANGDDDADLFGSDGSDGEGNGIEYENYPLSCLQGDTMY